MTKYRLYYQSRGQVKQAVLFEEQDIERFLKAVFGTVVKIVVEE